MKTTTLKASLNVSQILSLALLATGLAACVADTDDDVTTDEEASVSVQPETFTQTIVRRDVVGRETVQIRTITRAEQLAEQGQRERGLAISKANGEIGTASLPLSYNGASCSASSIWMFDQPGLSGNEICFEGAGAMAGRAGVLALDKYCRTAECSSRWGQNVRSFWTGTDSALFGMSSQLSCGQASTCRDLSTWQKATTATSCEQEARYLNLDTGCSTK